MAGSTPFTDALLELAASVHRLCGGRLVWKDVDPALRAAQGERIAFQLHPACLAVKADLAARQRCIAWCGVPGRSDVDRGRCHAGLVQWRWPLRDAGGLIGFACVGPFAHADAAGRAAPLPPPPPTETMDAVHGLLVPAIAGLVAARQRERAALGYHARHPCLQELLAQLQCSPDHGQRAADLAASLRLSPSRLQHLCRAELGLSLRQLRDRHVLLHARQLLNAPAGLPIKAIAARLGFRDHRAFATWFGRQMGMSPRRWRARHAV